MAGTGPGKARREGIPLKKFFKLFPTDAAAERWFVKQRWPDGIWCPRCGSFNVQVGTTHKTMPYRCREKVCGRKFFSVKTGTVMEGSKIGYQDWLLATFLLNTSLKSVSSMKLHRDLGITQKSAWFLAHRVRSGMADGAGDFAGPVEVDETYMGGKRKKMSNAKRKTMTGRGPTGKAAVVGAKDRATNKVAAKAVDSTDKETLQGFVAEHADPNATVYTDEAKAYESLPHNHDAVKHSLKEYVRGSVHTNGVVSFWSMLKRAHKGTFHKMSPKHLQRYVDEFAGKHNIRELDTIRQIEAVADGMDGKRLTYKALIKENGRASSARAA
ncbi:MAG: IS1595 family transposase [Bryobacterales bacterium]|nr:IS1595 family transposase [Bryobacterales bacterium]